MAYLRTVTSQKKTIIFYEQERKTTNVISCMFMTNKHYCSDNMYLCIKLPVVCHGMSSDIIHWYYYEEHP